MNISANSNINNNRSVKESFPCEEDFYTFQPTKWFHSFGRPGTGGDDMVIT